MICIAFCRSPNLLGFPPNANGEGLAMKKYLTAFALGSAVLLSAPVQAYDGYLGEVIEFAGNYCPRNTTEANGQLLPISTNQALFSILGTMYGGDGRTTFGLPNLNRQNRQNRPNRQRPLKCIVTAGSYPSRN